MGMAVRGLLQGGSRSLQRTTQLQVSPHLFSSKSFELGSSKNYSRVISNGCIFSLPHENQNASLLPRGAAISVHSRKKTALSIYLNSVRSLATKVAAPAQAHTGSFQVAMLSPGFVVEPYAVREPIPFWERWFTGNGWRRTKEEFFVQVKTAYALAKMRRTGYTKDQVYKEAIELYKQINFMLAHGDKKTLRKLVTEKMYSTLKNDIKQRESMWSTVYWEMVEPVIKIRTLRARMIPIDQKDLNKGFIQLTLEFLTKQKFEAYDSNGKAVAGDKSKEILVRDIWVFEKSTFHDGAKWRLCGKIML